MTNTQKEILEACMLGDGSLTLHGRSKNAIFRFKQSGVRKDYVDFIYRELGDKYVSCGVREETRRAPTRVNGKVSHLSEHWNGKFTHSSYFWSKAHPDFTEIRSRWYDNRQKNVPSDVLITPFILAHWYMQDGSNNISKSSKNISFATNGFERDQVERLSAQIRDDFDLDTTVYNRSGSIICVRAGSYFKFIELVRPYVEPFVCFKYKIDASNAPGDRKGKQWHGPKLTMSDAKEIRRLRSKENLRLKDIAEMFSVTCATVGKIINNQLYRETCFKISGNSEVRLGLNYGN